MTLADIRREYLGQPLDEQHSDPDPFGQFATWFEQVRELEPDPTAMALATATRDGRPSVRVVLLKGIDERGLVFYTNYESRKARELADTGLASLMFYWPSLNRQVRVEGTVEKVSGDESDAYFASRPQESRIAAAISPQSDPIAHREALDALYEQGRQHYAAGAVPRPAFWGGYRVLPAQFEFWQGRENRLHDRLRYRRHAGGWTRDRLAP
jgi:pyridoxamine 5'-phosphate oxidase